MGDGSAVLEGIGIDLGGAEDVYPWDFCVGIIIHQQLQFIVNTCHHNVDTVSECCFGSV